jgi:hypothetical protein
MEELIYGTTAEIGPFGECQIIFTCRYWAETLCPYSHDEPPEVEHEARVEIDKAKFYSNGRWIIMDKEEANNVGEGSAMSDEIIEHQQIVEQSLERDNRDSGGHEG